MKFGNWYCVPDFMRGDIGNLRRASVPLLFDEQEGVTVHFLSVVRKNLDRVACGADG